ncbi:MAG: hypothetical protein ACE5EI_09370 [Thermodesulfobacteriota bacterium]
MWKVCCRVCTWSFKWHVTDAGSVRGVCGLLAGARVLDLHRCGEFKPALYVERFFQLDDKGSWVPIPEPLSALKGYG